MQPQHMTIIQSPKLFYLHCSPWCSTLFSCSLGLAGTVLSLSFTLFSCSLGLAVPLILEVFVAQLCPQYSQSLFFNSHFTPSNGFSSIFVHPASRHYLV